MEIDREKALADVVKAIEEEYISLERKAERLGLNQPVIVAVSSTSSTIEPSTQDWNDQVGYSEFSVKLPTPALKVKSLQLLSANIPQANTNIPNTACVFWYYRLNRYSGITPNSENLYYVRLLPSYYKQELLNTPEIYGYNQTFKNYQSLNTTLNLSCANDPAYDNSLNYLGEQPYNIPFLPNEISFNYNTTTNRFSMIGTNATTEYCYREYTAETTYSIGDVVYQGTNVYKSLQNGNTGNDLTNTAFWEHIYIPIVQEWDEDTIYNENAIVRYNGELYQTNIRNTSQSPSGLFPFRTGYYYCKGQVVEVDGIRYTYINNQPSTELTDNSEYWGLTDYNNDTTYSEGYIVYYEGNYYYALEETTGHLPTDDIFWEQIGNFWNIGADTISNRYLITGYDDPNVLLRQGTAERQYNLYNLYEKDELVYHDGLSYYALYQNQSTPPFKTIGILPFNPIIQYQVGDRVSSLGDNYIAISLPPIGEYPSRLSIYWSIQRWDINLLDKVPIVSLSTISKKFDFYDRELDATFPVGIPPQPFNPNPKRLLNSILGFTFSGKFIPDAYSNITAGVVNELVPNSLLNQYNRLRPVPTYFIEPTLLENHPSYTSQTYTADGFCNLVYSSVLRIYCNLIFAGTLDNNLLGIIPFNCGNLGITFANNFIDTKITKIQDEIYEIKIRFEDEYGEPYVLTNNAVSTLLLKLTYKENTD